MRKLGCIFLIAGFTWLAALQVVTSLRGSIRPILRASYQKLSPEAAPTYTRELVESVVRESVVAAYDAQPIFLFPGFLMLVGGMVLAFSPRPAKQKEAGQ